MFDWNDEEVTNIIWGEAEEKPLVVIGDPAKKETVHHTLDASPLQQKRQTVKPEYGAGDSNSKSEIGASDVGHGIDLWPDPPTSSDVTKSSKNGYLKDKDSGIFENLPEDGEQDDFVDYGWANIGSFDDLDRIFSNNDPIFGDISVANADELWPSSKSVIGPPLSSDSSYLPVGPLRTSIEKAETNAQYMLDPGHSSSGYEKLSDVTSRASQDLQTLLTGEKIHTRYKQHNDGTVATLDEFRENGIKQKKSSKVQKSSNKSELKHPHTLSSRWISSSYAQPMVNHQTPPLVLSHQIPLQRPVPFHPLNPFPGAPPLYGNMTSQYSSGYELPTDNATPLKNSENVSTRPPEMTPKEKIKKLRRRQQMRAILAIQKQQLQFKNQASGSEHSSLEGGKVEVDESLVSFPDSSVEQYESNTISADLDNCSVEESVLYRLQDTIAKMDMRTRLCIRDSLFRLAKSAMSRQHPNANANSRDEIRSNKDIVTHERFTRMPNAETDTNPIDRMVAHLLFHRPLEVSGKLVETPESPLSANLWYVKNSNPMKSLAKETRVTTLMESETAQFSESNQSKSGLCFLSCDNATDDENADADKG